MVISTSPGADDESENGDELESSGVRAEVEARSAENIRSWKEYLPDDCIATMIRMNWHEST